MSDITFNPYPQFFTATILEWKYLLADDAFKDIIISSLQFLVNDGRVIIYGFAIMPNHIHLIWQVQDKYQNSSVQQSFLKYTAQQIKFDLLKNNLSLLDQYKTIAADRDYCFWKRRSLGIELFTHKVYQQKLDYIHNNPVKAGLCKYPEQYHYSSAGFYYTRIDKFNMLTY